MKYEWLNTNSRKFLSEGYLLPGTTPEQRIRDIAEKAESINGITGFADKFENYMSRGYYSLSTPIWCNYGVERGLGISCFGIEVQDNTADILRGVGEIGMMTKNGGGTATWFGNVRARGSAISGNGVSNGSVSFMEMFDKTMTVISQGRARRGYMAAYLPIDHGDIDEFLNIRSEGHNVQELAIGVTIPEGWLDSMRDGDKEKRKVWAKVLKKRSETGFPYLMFEDNVNNNLPQVYKDKGMEVKTSQLCVAGDQLVPTQFGLKTAKELFELGEELILTDGEKLVKSSPMKLIEKQVPTYKITLANGMTHTVTDYHKVLVNNDGQSILKKTSDLKPDDKVFIQSCSGIFGFKLNYERSFIKSLVREFETSGIIPEYILEGAFETQLFFVKELFGVSDLSNAVYNFTEVTSNSSTYLQLIVSNLGYETGLTATSLFIEEKYEDRKYYSKVVLVKPDEIQDVYCVTVDSEEHLWVCNGVVTSNCSEILEYTDEEKSFTCCLSSINLLHWDEIKNTDAVETLTYFLDTVLTEFIEKSEGIPFMEKTVKFAKEHRSIGLGVLGWHSYLQSHMIPFEGLQSKQLTTEIFKFIQDKSLVASKELAKLFGEPKILEGYGERFSTRLAIAPTTSSSFILGQVSPSIEPLMSNYFVKDLAKGKFSFKNPYLLELLESKGKNTKEIWQSITKKGGSVQHLDFLTSHEKSVFKTFGEISQLEIIQQASVRQKYIDQGQSLNLLIHPDTPVKDINALILEAHKLGIKTLYYQRSVNLAQEVGRNLMVCQSCEG